MDQLVGVALGVTGLGGATLIAAQLSALVDERRAKRAAAARTEARIRQVRGRGPTGPRLAAMESVTGRHPVIGPRYPTGPVDRPSGARGVRKTVEIGDLVGAMAFDADPTLALEPVRRLPADRDHVKRLEGHIRFKDSVILGLQEDRRTLENALRAQGAELDAALVELARERATRPAANPVASALFGRPRTFAALQNILGTDAKDLEPVLLRLMHIDELVARDGYGPDATYRLTTLAERPVQDVLPVADLDLTARRAETT